jgi:regulator of sigma E protease
MDFLGIIGQAGNLLTGYLLPFLFVLTLVIFIHEMGHFLAGRWCGTDVSVFSIGFGRELFGFTDRKGTRWQLAAIPLGGYVKFAGDANGASMPDDAALKGLTPEERSRTFPGKSLAQRAFIVAAGPIANFILAIAIFGGSAYFLGRQVLTPRVETVVPGGAADKAGFLAGDIVVAIDGKETASFSEMQRAMSTRPEEKINVRVNRDGRIIALVVVPELREMKSALGKQRVGMIGIQASRKPEDLHVKSLGLGEAVLFGATESWFVVERTFDYLGKLIAGRESTDQLSGPLRIAQASGYVATNSGILGLITLAGVLSVSIGLMNLFPVPMLDGGHLMFYAIEAVRGRPLSEKAQEYGFRVGMALVLMLMVFVTFNDIVHISSLFTGAGS